jgi:hypothetical protein
MIFRRAMLAVLSLAAVLCFCFSGMFAGAEDDFVVCIQEIQFLDANGSVAGNDSAGLPRRAMSW